MIIAVDGPAAAGKGTIARALAERFGFHFLDTGLLYRMVGHAMLEAGLDPADPEAAIRAAEGLDPNRYAMTDLRAQAVADAASLVAVIPEVRRALLGFQRDFARKPPGAVLDGRDIGTVVCPEATVKIFVTATPEVRAERRARELAEAGVPVDFPSVLAEIRTRDERDKKRLTAPLVPARDAYILDTSDMDVKEAVEKAAAAVEARRVR
ncbi:MAG: (d)CMP kinase [Hyphomicrobiales bacterium]